MMGMMKMKECLCNRMVPDGIIITGANHPIPLIGSEIILQNLSEQIQMDIITKFDYLKRYELDLLCDIVAENINKVVNSAISMD